MVTIIRASQKKGIYVQQEVALNQHQHTSKEKAKPPHTHQLHQIRGGNADAQMHNLCSSCAWSLQGLLCYSHSCRMIFLWQVPSFMICDGMWQRLVWHKKEVQSTAQLNQQGNGAKWSQTTSLYVATLVLPQCLSLTENDCLEGRGSSFAGRNLYSTAESHTKITPFPLSFGNSYLKFHLLN